MTHKKTGMKRATSRHRVQASGSSDRQERAIEKRERQQARKEIQNAGVREENSP